MTKRASSKPASSPTPNTARWAHDAARQLQMRKALAVRTLACGDGNTSEKVSQTMPNTAGTCVTLEIHFGRKPSRANSTSVVRPYKHPGQPLPLHVGIDHHEAEMGDLSRLAVELDVHHRQRIEGDRPAGRLLVDQRDDGARQTFALAGEDAVGEAAGRQRLAGDGAQICDQSVEFGLDSDAPGLSTIRVAGRHGCAR